MRKALFAALVALCALLVILYVADYAVLRVRIARHGPAAVLSTVTVFYAAPLNGGKVSVFYDQPQMQPCVRAIFPQLGHAPCWYIRRHSIQVID